MYHIGDRVHFWTGRGSQGYATIQEIRGENYLLVPKPEAIKGPDFRNLKTCPRRTWWGPRDRGVLIDQLNTPPKIWYTDF